jgi:hypothetical protein
MVRHNEQLYGGRRFGQGSLDLRPLFFIAESTAIIHQADPLRLVDE